MFAVIFEVQPHPDRRDTYLDLAKLLRPELLRIEGFIDNERFTSATVPDRILSLSLWRDEKAVIRWRTVAMHHSVQEMGRSSVFADYHLRVGEVTADSDAAAGTLPQMRFDTTETGSAPLVTITHLRERDHGASLPLPSGTDAHGLVSADRYTSITTVGKELWLASWRDEAATGAWEAQLPEPGVAGRRHQRVHIIRDYGMYARHEAPQYYPPVSST